jgi:hypothetical protein
MEKIMNDDMINVYINLMSQQLNQLNNENLVLKAKLSVTEQTLNQLQSTKEEEPVDNGERNKAKKK